MSGGGVFTMGGGTSLRGSSPEVTGYAVPSKEVTSKFAK